MKKIIIEKKTSLTILFLIILSFSCSKQPEKPNKKYLNKVQTIDSIVKNFYASISENKGEGRDWKLFKFLFHPEGKIIRHRPSKDGIYSAIYYTPDDFVKKYGKYIEKVDLLENPIFSKESTFGPISHVLSGYEFYEKGDEKPNRGVNSFQLLNDGERWWIINAYSTHETPNNQIPKEFFRRSKDSIN